MLQQYGEKFNQQPSITPQKFPNPTKQESRDHLHFHVLSRPWICIATLKFQYFQGPVGTLLVNDKLVEVTRTLGLVSRLSTTPRGYYVNLGLQRSHRDLDHRGMSRWSVVSGQARVSSVLVTVMELGPKWTRFNVYLGDTQLKARSGLPIHVNWTSFR